MSKIDCEMRRARAKSNSRPYCINRSVINIELKAVHSDYHDGAAARLNDKTTMDKIIEQKIKDAASVVVIGDFYDLKKA